MEYSAGNDGLSLQVRFLATERNDTLISAGLKDRSKRRREKSNCPSYRTPVWHWFVRLSIHLAASSSAAKYMCNCCF